MLTPVFRFRLLSSIAILGLVSISGGCSQSHGSSEVIVYTALDSEFSRPIFDQFTAETGITVRPKFDTEANKTVGLANAIIAEANRPRADVFWNNEILNTLRLRKRGLLDVYIPPQADDYPPMYRAEDGSWHGFAARARVLLVNTDLVSQKEMPRSIHDLADPRRRGKIGLAKPLFGTTATHAAALFAAWGDVAAEEFFKKLKANGVKILPGNKQVAREVSAGRLAFGLTDTDDAIIEVEGGQPVAIVYPDQDEGGVGTLFIPNTLAVVKGGKNRQEARKLIDYLLTPRVEDRLALCPSAQIPLGKKASVPPRVSSPKAIRGMKVDFEKAAEKWEHSARFLRDLYSLEP